MSSINIVFNVSTGDHWNILISFQIHIIGASHKIILWIKRDSTIGSRPFPVRSTHLRLTTLNSCNFWTNNGRREKENKKRYNGFLALNMLSKKKVSHWPSDHMTSLRPQIGQPPPSVEGLLSPAYSSIILITFAHFC